MHWIEEFTKGSFSLFSGNTIEGFQPLDFFHFYPLWYDVWLKKIIAAMEKIDAENKSYAELRDVLPGPSNMRALIQKAIPAYIGSDCSKKIEYRRYVSFVARMLREACPEDPFGIARNLLHRPSEISDIIKNTVWRSGNPETARLLGQFITAAGSLVHGLYNDVVTDFGWDAYGPYDRVEKDGQEYTLLIRDFSDLAPEPLWPVALMSSVKKVQIFQLYQNVEWAIGCVGCHTIVKSGKPIEGLKFYAVLFDGKPVSDADVKRLLDELLQKAEAIYRAIRQKNFEELKVMVIWQECYQLKKFFESAGVDWRPDQTMLGRIKNMPLKTGVLPHGKMVTTLEEYKELFRMREFAREVLGEVI